MATIQGECGKIKLFEDFLGAEWIISRSAASGRVGEGPFRVIGDGVAETGDSGILVAEDPTDVPLNGVGIFAVTDEDLHCCGLSTSLCFDAALMAPIVAELRVQFADLDSKHFYFGLSGVNADAEILETNIISDDASTTFTLTGTSICGFLWSADLTDSADWHAVFKGGTTTGVTDSTALDLDEDIVAGEFQILRLEIDPNGTARWFVDGALKKTQTGAVSTSADFAILSLCSNTGTDAEFAYVDYMYVEANRDWTV